MRLSVLGSLLLVLTCGAEAFAQRAIVLVRHAERLDRSEDSPLSADGRTRAAALAETLRSAGVTEIFVTEYRRTQATAAPLAMRLQIKPQITRATEVDALVERLRHVPADAVVLVVGHSNTVPMILAGLGWTGHAPLSDTDYDNLFVLTPRGESEPAVLRLKFGRKTS